MKKTILCIPKKITLKIMLIESHKLHISSFEDVLTKKMGFLPKKPIEYNTNINSSQPHPFVYPQTMESMLQSKPHLTSRD